MRKGIGAILVLWAPLTLVGFIVADGGLIALAQVAGIALFVGATAAGIVYGMTLLMPDPTKASDEESFYDAVVKDYDDEQPAGSSDELIDYDPAEPKLRDRAAALGLELMTIRPSSSAETEPRYAIAEGARILHNGLTAVGAAEVLAQEEARADEKPDDEQETEARP